MSLSTEIESVAKEKAQPENPVCCAKCGQVIVRAKVARQLTKGEHTFRNPAGYSFHVLTFSQVEACLAVGESSLQDTWFPGFAWTILVCESCHQHLGWLFSSQSDEDSFCGLIKTRVC